MRYVFQSDYKDIPYITRTDTPEVELGHRTTFASSGCGLSSGIMVVDRLLVDPDFGPEEAVALSVESGANHAPGTDMIIYSKALAAKFNLRTVTSNDTAEAIRCLQTGGCVIANVWNTPAHKAIFTKGAHYITLVSVTEDGRFAVLDPSGEKPGKFDEAIAAGLVEKVGRIEYVRPEILEQETYGTPQQIGDSFYEVNRYYLFWRN